MSITVIAVLNAVLLIAQALLWTLLCARAGYALYRNHLTHRVRVVIIGTFMLSLTMSFEHWLRAWGRVCEQATGTALVLPHPLATLVTLVFSTFGLLGFIVAVEITTQLGVHRNRTEG